MQLVGSPLESVTAEHLDRVWPDTGPTDKDLVAHCGLPPRDARFPHMTRTAWSPNPRGQTVDAFHTTGRASLATTQTALPGARTHSENLDYIEVGADQHALSAHHSFDGR